MATFNVYNLRFTSPLHIGNCHADDGQSLKSISSDTLYAALTSCLAKTGKAIPADGDLGFAVSSLFPYYQRNENSRSTYFLPMPMPAKRAKLSDLSMTKKLKKVKWVDTPLFAKIISGERHFDLNNQIASIQGCYLTQEELPTDANGSKEFVCSEVSQRVTLKSRTGEDDATPYFVDKVLFRHYSGLYFIAEGNTDILEHALHILSIEGIGTDRNVGYGFFDFTKDTITIDFPSDADHLVSLSLFIPESEKQMKALLASDQVAYDFTRIGGWITSAPHTTLRKNAIYGFLPGSVFSNISGANNVSVLGKIVDLQPTSTDFSIGHPVWRCGRSVMLPYKLR